MLVNIECLIIKKMVKMKCLVNKPRRGMCRVDMVQMHIRRCQFRNSPQ